jgi:hypothetical protein
LTAQIASVIDDALAPRGLAVMLEAEHQCMTMRGIQKQGVSTITTQFTGVFQDEPAEQAKFMTLVRGMERLRFPPLPICFSGKGFPPTCLKFEFTERGDKKCGRGRRRFLCRNMIRRRPDRRRRDRSSRQVKC